MLRDLPARGTADAENSLERGCTIFHRFSSCSCEVVVKTEARKNEDEEFLYIGGPLGPLGPIVQCSVVCNTVTCVAIVAVSSATN